MSTRPSALFGILVGSVLGLMVWAVLIFAATYAFAGSYTVQTTADQDAALAELAKQPVRVAGATAPTPRTPAQIIQTMVDNGLSGRVRQIQRTNACAKVTDAAAKTALGCPVK